jgi:hypothetical protein
MKNCARCKKDEEPAFTKSFRMRGISGVAAEHVRHLCAGCAGELVDDAGRQAFLETTLGMARRKTRAPLSQE